ncbi:MAG: PKD domain-containing protein [Bacteroidia bacterium]
MKKHLIYFLILTSCTAKNEIQIDTNTSVYFSKQEIHFSAKANFKVKNWEWKILENDSVVSNESLASINFTRKGNYTIQVKAKGNFGKNATAEKKVVVNPSYGFERMIWSDVMGARYEISFWAYGTRYDGVAHFDSVYYSVMAGPQLSPSETCAQLTHAPSLYLPGGSYTIYYKYKTQPLNPFISGSYSIEMDGNCN